jgi:hypothetical protein
MCPNMTSPTKNIQVQQSTLLSESTIGWLYMMVHKGKKNPHIRAFGGALEVCDTYPYLTSPS